MSIFPLENSSEHSNFESSEFDPSWKFCLAWPDISGGTLGLFSVFTSETFMFFWLPIFSLENSSWHSNFESSEFDPSCVLWWLFSEFSLETLLSKSAKFGISFWDSLIISIGLLLTSIPSGVKNNFGLFANEKVSTIFKPWFTSAEKTSSSKASTSSLMISFSGLKVSKSRKQFMMS